MRDKDKKLRYPTSSFLNIIFPTVYIYILIFILVMFTSVFSLLRITRLQWKEAMSKGTGLTNFPWLLIQPRIVTTELDGTIVYARMFIALRHSRSRMLENWNAVVVKDVVSRFKDECELRDALTAMDKDKDGWVNKLELLEGLKTLGIVLTEAQGQSFLRSFVATSNVAEKVSMEVFVNNFQFVFRSIMVEKQRKEKWMWDVVADINSIFTASEVTVYEAFKIFDKHERGHLSLQRFEHAIRHLLGRARLTKPQIYELFQFFDADNDETIDFDEFKKKFAEVGGQEEAMSWLSTFVDNCADALLTYDVALEKLFRELDEEGEGYIDKEGFLAVMQVLGEQEPHLGITSQQALQLFSILDTNKDGLVDYEEFMELSRPDSFLMDYK